MNGKRCREFGMFNTRNLEANKKALLVTSSSSTAVTHATATAAATATVVTHACDPLTERLRLFLFANRNGLHDGNWGDENNGDDWLGGLCGNLGGDWLGGVVCAHVCMHA